MEGFYRLKHIPTGLYYKPLNGIIKVIKLVQFKRGI